MTAPLTDFVYGGMFYNADSGLYLATHRAYDPIAARWLSRDPLAETSDASANLYPYVGGNPLTFVDPAGRQAQIAIPFIAGGAVACGPVCWAIIGGATAGVIIDKIINEMSGPDETPKGPSTDVDQKHTHAGPGSRPISQTPWSGDHQKIKEGIGAGPSDDVRIDPQGGIWVKQPDGTWTGPHTNGYAGDYTGSGNPSGRRGKDRDRRRGGDDCD